MHREIEFTEYVRKVSLQPSETGSLLSGIFIEDENGKGEVINCIVYAHRQSLIVLLTGFQIQNF